MPKVFKGYVPIERPSFTLESPDGDRKLEVICEAMVPGSTFLDFLANIDEEDPSTIAGTLNAIFIAAVPAETYDDFRAFIDDPKNGVDISMLGELAGYLSEVYAKRPPKPSVA